MGHEYFTAGYDPNLRVEPDQQTREVFQDNGLIIKQHYKWFSIYAPDSFDLEAFLHENNSVWQFACNPAEPVFFNYTDMGFGPAMWLFSNANLDEDGSILNSKLITTEAFGPQAGTIDIHLNELTPADPEKPVQYKLRFNSRKVSIRYHIIFNKQGSFPLGLVGEHADLFSDPILAELDNGIKTYLIDSGDNLFPMKETSTTQLKVKIMYNSIENEMVLPNASPNFLEFDGQKYICPIYVYI
jgi:hypothetical protein